MITLTVPLKYKGYEDVLRLIPMFDLHVGHAACDLRAIKSDMARLERNSYIIGGGDWLDSIVTSDLKRYQKSSDATEGDAIIDEQLATVKEIFEPHRKKILGLGIGNHEQVVIKRCGTNPIKRLCDEWKIPYLGFSGLIRLNLRKEQGGGGRAVVIRFHHGWGGGSRTQGADLTKFSKDITHWDADIYLYGHVHRKQTDRIPRLGISGSSLVAKPKLIGICGTYLKTYTQSADPTYSEVAGYPPTEIGHLSLCIKPKQRWVEMWWADR